MYLYFLLFVLGIKNICVLFIVKIVKFWFVRNVWVVKMKYNLILIEDLLKIKEVNEFLEKRNFMWLNIEMKEFFVDDIIFIEK